MARRRRSDPAAPPLSINAPRGHAARAGVAFKHQDLPPHHDRHDIADDAQLNIGAALQLEGKDQEAVTAFIARRYRVADEAVAGFVSAAYRAGRQFAVDPLLILAVMAVESRYNPVAESGVGAKGLMQVLPRFHLDKLEPHGGEEALLDPDVNIEVGTQILREYLRRFGQTVTALQQYAGAMDEPNTEYANKVLTERSRLQWVLDRARRKS